jgi:acetyltransferase-like isoleucine patch superfamily enzyme
MQRYETITATLAASERSPFRAYHALAVGDAGLRFLLWYELLGCIAAPVPGALGLALRRLAYPGLLGAAGPGLIVGRNVTLRHPQRIFCGSRVTIDDYALLDARGCGADGLQLEDGVLVNRGVSPKCKAGPMRLGAGTIVGQNTQIASLSGTEIGSGVLIASNCVITAGAYPTELTGHPMRSEGAVSKGRIAIGDDVWIGTGAMILGGITVGPHAIVAAGAVVTTHVPAGTIVGGVPAKVIRERAPGDRAELLECA